MSSRGSAVRGLVLVAALAAGCRCTSHATAPATGPLAGSWGGGQASLVVDEDGARVELPCADGRIDGPIVLDEGRFDGSGPWWPGPVPPVEPLSARYDGRVVGSMLELTIFRVPEGPSYGPFVLIRDREPTFPRCQ